MTDSADLVVINAAVYSCVPKSDRAEAFAVSDGKFTAVGATDDIRPLIGPHTQVVDAGGRMIAPGLCDVHIHLGLGGGQAAWELPIPPTATADEIYQAVSDWAATLGPDEWVVGGIVGSTVMDEIATADALARLDEAAAGRPVLLRDDSMHNRWVNSPALAAMGVTADTHDPDGGTFVRDAEGRLTGVLWEMASAAAEAAFAASIADPEARARVAYATAASLCNQFGITTVQEAATMEAALRSLSALEKDSELTLRVVTSTPAREFLEPGTAGLELIKLSEKYRSELLNIDFVKVVLDGIPMTRTSAMLTPYLMRNCCDHAEVGECLYTLDDLVETLEMAVRFGRGAKIHATGDASTRLALDAIAVVRERHGSQPRFQIAHTEFISESDIPRFGELNVVADASPYIWYPSIIQESIAKQVPRHYVDTSWPLRDLLTSGANVSAGSDWPCALSSPDPWTGLEALVTRQAPGGDSPALNPDQSLSLSDALAAFTRLPAEAMGLGDQVGTIETGKSADFIILNQNLTEIDATAIHATRVDETYLRGHRVYQNTDID